MPAIEAPLACVLIASGLNAVPALVQADLAMEIRGLHARHREAALELAAQAPRTCTKPCSSLDRHRGSSPRSGVNAKNFDIEVEGGLLY